jgi:hypothetical protein
MCDSCVTYSSRSTKRALDRITLWFSVRRIREFCGDTAASGISSEQNNSKQLEHCSFRPFSPSEVNPAELVASSASDPSSCSCAFPSCRDLLRGERDSRLIETAFNDVELRQRKAWTEKVVVVVVSRARGLSVYARLSLLGSVCSLCRSRSRGDEWLPVSGSLRTITIGL